MIFSKFRRLSREEASVPGMNGLFETLGRVGTGWAVLLATMIGPWCSLSARSNISTDAETVFHRDDDPVGAAYDSLMRQPADIRRAVINEVEQGILALKNPIIEEWRRTAKKARRELKVVPAAALEYYDPAKYAPGQDVVRRLLEPDHQKVQRKRDIYRCIENESQFVAEVIYDFATNKASQVREPLSAEEKLWNYLFGLPEDVDYIVAWISAELDHDKSLDKSAAHFHHLYCDLDGYAYSGITLYDAFASKENMDMPDVDVIPCARKILRDNSFVSPIPSGRKRNRLYEDIKEVFLKYFQHRTFVETSANMWVNPEFELRPEHENLRDRVLFAYHEEEGDLGAYRKRVKKLKDREGFINDIDNRAQRIKRWRRQGDKFRASRNAARSAIIVETHRVLKEYGFLTER